MRYQPQTDLSAGNSLFRTRRLLWAVALASVVRVTVAVSAPVSEGMALGVAQNWIQRSVVFATARAQLGGGQDFTADRILPLRLDPAYPTMAYHAPLKPRGYIVLAADDRISPVLCFSADGDLDLADTPRNSLRAMIIHDLTTSFQALASADADRQMGSSTRAAEAFAGNQTRWAALAAPPAPLVQSGEDAGAKIEAVLIGPLLSTAWSQWKHFNHRCPSDPQPGPGYDGKAPAGCTPVAGAQLMKYYDWPTRGMEGHTDEDSNTNNLIWGQFTTRFTDAFDWSNMHNSYDPWNDGEPSNAVAAVSELIYKLGVAVDTDFGSYSNGGSRSWLDSLDRALPQYFSYERSNFITRVAQPLAFDAAIRQDVLAGLPVLASRPEHVLLVDGVAAEPTGDVFHLNQGWGGTNDGWYQFSNIDVSSLDQAILGLRPKRVPLLSPAGGATNVTGKVDLAWTFPRARQAEVANFRLMQAVFSPGEFLDTAGDFSRWARNGESWSMVAPGRGGTGTCFRIPGTLGTHFLTLTDPVRPASGARLQFAYKAILADDHLRIKASTDAGLTWSTLNDLTKTGWDLAWHTNSLDLTSALGRPTLIRFEYSFASGSYYSTNGAVWLDDIRITNADFLVWTVVNDSLAANATNYTVAVSNDDTHYFAVEAYDGANWCTASPPEPVVVQIDPALRDTDADGLPDLWEQTYFGSVTGAVAEADSDGDGMNNRAEFLAGTGPKSPLDRLFISQGGPAEQGMGIQWSSVPGRTYSVRRGVGLSRLSFVPVATSLIATASVSSYYDGDAAGPGPFFYRVLLEMPP